MMLPDSSEFGISIGLCPNSDEFGDDLFHDYVMISSGGIRTHSIPGSKPRWSASCLPSHVICDC